MRAGRRAPCCRTWLASTSTAWVPIMSRHHAGTHYVVCVADREVIGRNSANIYALTRSPRELGVGGDRARRVDADTTAP
jgi:hypothetical protein